MPAPFGVRFRLNRAGVGELLRSPGLAAELLRIAEAIKTEAEATAPVGTPPGDAHPGEYRASFVTTVGESTTRGGRRAVATVANVSPHAAAVEYGAEGGRGGAHHTLLRAALTAGHGGP